MSISIDNPNSPTDNKRSPFTLSILEISLAIFVGLASWFGLRGFLQSALPFPCGSSVNDLTINCGWTAEQAWQTLGYPMFSTYAIPLVSLLAISSVFLVRSIRRDVRQFSVIGNLALSWPIFSFLGFFFLSVFSLIFLPIGFVLAILATINSQELDKRYKWDWVSLPFSLIWLVVFGMFIGKILNIYGD
jgi:hypothetical protein